MLKYYLALGISILFNCLSLILLKLAAQSSQALMENIKSLAAWFRLLTNGYMLGAMVCFGLSLVTWMIALMKIDLSLAYPVVSLSYVVIALSSWVLFQENITVYRWMGMGIIIFGVILMFKQA